MTSRILPCMFLLIVLFTFTTVSHSLDCRKFVFAPVCRGIIAKRVDTLNARLARPNSWGPSYPGVPGTSSDRFLGAPKTSNNEDGSHRHSTEIDGDLSGLDYEFLMRNFPDDRQ